MYIVGGYRRKQLQQRLFLHFAVKFALTAAFGVKQVRKAP
jgi:hypothetical protein